MRQKSLRDFIADAFAIKDSEITRLTLFRDTLRNGAQFVIVSFGLASWYARRSVREGKEKERELQIMRGIICCKKKKRKRREKKGKRVVVEKIRIPRRLKLVLR